MTLIEDDTMLSPPSRTNDDCGNDDGSSITVGKGTDNVMHHNDTADSQEDHQQHRHLVASSKAENGSELRNSVIGQSVDQVKRAINQTTDTTTTTTTSSSFSLIANVGQLALQPLLPHTDGVDSMITQQHQQRPPFNNDSDNNVMPSIQLHQQQDELALLPPHVHVHGSAFYQGLSCLCTMEDLIRDGCDANFVEYQSYPSLKWQPALFEQSIIQQVCLTA